MKITQVSLFRKDLPMLCGKFTCSLEPGVSFAEVVLVRIETDEGLVGYGESGTIGSYPGYAQGVLVNAAELIRHHLLTLDPSNVSNVLHTQSMMVGQGYVKAAFDIACWDLFGKSLNQPIWKLLGGELQESVPLYRSITADSPQELLSGVDVWRGEGYRDFQLKAGFKTPAEDIERIGTVLAAKQKNESYTIDPVGRWSVHQARYILQALREFEFMVEQPCNTYRECLSLRRNTDVPIKLDNIITEPSNILQAYADDACDAFSFKLNNMGGISSTRIARELSSNMAMSATIDSMWGTEITSAAIIHLGMTTEPAKLLNTCDMHNYTSYSVVADDNILVEDGRMSFKEAKPGLGIEVLDKLLGEPDIVIQ